MKTLKKDLNIDFIGEQKPLTKAEEAALSEYFKNLKLKKNRRVRVLSKSKPELHT